MDETPVCSFQGYSFGNVVEHPKSDREPLQPYNRGRRRLHMTYACFICNIARLQRKLPQVILMNEKMCTNTEYRRILAATPPNVYVKREKSAWMNETIMCILVRLLHAHLKDVWNDYHVVLMLDAFGGHIHYNVQLQCNRFGIVLIIIPASLTWLLQPCDTHVFCIFKKHLRRMWAGVTNEAEEGFIDVVALLTLVFEVIEDIVNGTDWNYAFKEDGFYTHFAFLSSYIMQKLEYTEKPSINIQIPCLADIQCCFPKRHVVVERILLKILHQTMLALPAPAVSASALQNGGASSSEAQGHSLPRGTPLRPKRPLPALQLAPGSTRLESCQAKEEMDRNSQMKPPPVTRSMSRALEMATGQVSSREQDESTTPSSRTATNEPPRKQRKLPWKRRSPTCDARGTT